MASVAKSITRTSLGFLISEPTFSGQASPPSFEPSLLTLDSGTLSAWAGTNLPSAGPSTSARAEFLCVVSQNLAPSPTGHTLPLPCPFLPVTGTPITAGIKLAFGVRGPQKPIGLELSTTALEYLVCIISGRHAQSYILTLFLKI